MSNSKPVIIQWLKNNPLVFQWKEDNNLIVFNELASLKTFNFDVTEVVDHRLTPHPQGFADYLNLVFRNETQIVLTHAGLAFAPDFQNTGPLDDAPAVVCMMDYYQLYNHLVDLCKIEEQAGQALRLFEVLIAVLDGAKKIGLDVNAEEEQLDKLLSDFEKN